MIEKRLEDSLFEAFLRQAVIEEHEQELAEIPSEVELAKLYTFSKRHNKRMKELFLSDERRERRSRFFKSVRNIAAGVLIAFGVMFLTIMCIPSVRAAVAEAIVEWYEQYILFTPTANDTEQTEDTQTKDWSPKYLPPEFEVAETYSDSNMTSVTYKNPHSVIIRFTYMPSDSSLAVNNNETEYTEVTDNGVRYYTFLATSSEKSTSVIWDNSGYRFELRGNYDIDELMKMALSVT